MKGKVVDELEKPSLLELIDNLIYHINSERVWFNALCLSSIIAAPISIFFTVFLLLHPGVINRLLRLQYSMGLLLIFYLVLNLFISSLWLIVGLREFRFLAKWNSRFKRYFSLKEQLDRELQREFEEESR